MAESQIKNRVLDLLEQVKDSNNTDLFSSKRLLDLKADNNNCEVSLRSSDLSTEELKLITTQITLVLKDIYTAEQIKVNSMDSKPQVKAVEDSAQLKVGHEDQSQGKKTLSQVKNIIAIASGKGGVGKSTFTANLAYALMQSGKKVGLVDADIYGPSLPMLLGKRDAKPRGNEQKKMLPIEAGGIQFMSFGLFIDEKDPVIWRGPMLGGVINQFLFDVAWPELDYLLIDMPPGTGDIQLSLSQMIDLSGAIIISTPQDIAFLDARKGLNMFKRVNIPILGIVENMSHFIGDDGKKYYIFGEGNLEQSAKELETNLLGKVPLEIALRECSDKGTPYMLNKDFEGREVWNSFMAIAQKLVEQTVSKKEKKGFLGRIFK